MDVEAPVTHGPRGRRARAAGTLVLAACLALLGACGSGGTDGGGGVAAPVVAYAVTSAALRVGEAPAPNAPSVTGGAAETFAVSPPLPPGMTFDETTGVIAGLPTAEASMTSHVVTASNAGGASEATVVIAVGPALPAAIEHLADGFAAEIVVDGLAGAPKVAKIVLAPDGRLFFAEVDTGQVRVIDAGGTLLPTPFLTLTVLTGGHQGLLGLALDPDFQTNGYVYVQACVPGDGMTTVDRQAVYRYTDVANVGTNQTVIVDGLPISASGVGGINCGGELAFDATGALLVSVGDCEVETDAQADAATSLAGKVLRYLPTAPATIPADNPSPTSPTWCRGMRNCFGIAVHPTTGGIFSVDNGPASDDELNFLQRGRNFEWGGMPASNLGLKLRNYPDVIVPTAIAWHDGTGWGADYADNLFMTTYDDQVVRRLEMSGPTLVDIDDESEWARFVEVTVEHKPLDVLVDPADGCIYVSTFTGIYRFFRIL